MIVYNKAVRDRIPEIMRAQGKVCRVEVLDEELWLKELSRKLGEELKEYLDAGDMAELADIVEVVHGIVRTKGASIEEFEKLRLEKRDARGGFDERILLLSVE